MLADAADLTGILRVLGRNGIWVAAVLMPAGFFPSSGRDVERPNKLVVLVYAGAGSLALGVASLGVGLLRST